MGLKDGRICVSRSSRYLYPGLMTIAIPRLQTPSDRQGMAGSWPFNSQEIRLDRQNRPSYQN